MRKIALSTVIYSGQNALDHLKSYESLRVFIVADPFIMASPILKQIEELLASGGNDVKWFSDVVPDPPVENVVAGVKEIEAFEPDHMIAIGGGSTIDAAKAMKEFANKIYHFPDFPLTAIPTTSGTGSEVTSFSIITDDSKGIKYPLVSDALIPDEAILDPELVKSVPQPITADTGMDALTHAIEAYVATNANDFSDAMAEKAIRLIFHYLKATYHDKDNDAAREKVHHASTMAGIAFNIAGLGINHSIAHACGAKFHIPHGRLNGILLPNVIAYNAGIKGFNNADLRPAAGKYAEIARLLGLPATTDASGTRSLIKEIEKLRKELDMPADFKGYTIDNTESTIEEIAEAALDDSCTDTNPVPPEKADIISVLKGLI